MRVLVQRISEGWVAWEGQETPHAGAGLLCLVGFHVSDGPRAIARNRGGVFSF